MYIKRNLGNRISKLMRKGWEVKRVGDETHPQVVCYNFYLDLVKQQLENF